MIAIALLAAATASPVACAPFDRIAADLAQVGQEIIAIGEAPDQADMVLLGDPDTGTWTLLAVREETACIVIWGGGLRLSLPVPGEPA